MSSCLVSIRTYFTDGFKYDKLSCNTI